MKRHPIAPYKILAVALSAGAGTGTTSCSSPARPTPDVVQAPTTAAEPRQPTADSRRRTTDNGRRTADSGQRTADSGQRTADSGQRTADDGQPTAAVLALAAELELERDGKAALHHQPHYRPLCDRDGYPLVGNVMRKGPPVALQPSELCAAVRAKQAAR